MEVAGGANLGGNHSPSVGEKGEEGNENFDLEPEHRTPERSRNHIN